MTKKLNYDLRHQRKIRQNSGQHSSAVFTTPQIHCHYRREFNNSFLKVLRKLLDFKIMYSSVGHPQSKGSLDRFHSTLIEMIRILMSKNPNEHTFILPHAVKVNNNFIGRTHEFKPLATHQADHLILFKNYSK